MQDIYFEIPILVPNSATVGILIGVQFIVLIAWIIIKKIKETIPVIG